MLLEVPRFPAASAARACSVCVPLAAVVVFQENAYGVVVSLPAATPSTRNVTLATPEPPALSVAVAVMVTVFETTALAAGAVKATVGGVVSTTVFCTVTDTLVELP